MPESENYDYTSVDSAYKQPLIRQNGKWGPGVMIADQTTKNDNEIILAADGNRFVEGTSIQVLIPANTPEPSLSEVTQILPAVAYFSSKILNTTDNNEIDFSDTDEWLRERSAKPDTQTEIVPLEKDDDWQDDGQILEHKGGKFFTVNMSDEKPPLIVEHGEGIVELPIRQHEGRTEVLIKFRKEPGNPKGILAPANQFSASNPNGKSLDLNDPKINKVTYPENFYRKTNAYQLGELTNNHKVKIDEQWVDVRWLLTKMVHSPGLVGEHLAVALWPVVRDFR